MGLWSKIKKAAKNIWSGVRKVAKKVWNSKVGRVIVIAAAIYTGGAFLGAMASGTGMGGFMTALQTPSLAMSGYAHAGKAALDAGAALTAGVKEGFAGGAAKAAGPGGAATPPAGGGLMGGGATGATSVKTPGLMASAGRAIGGAGKWAMNNPIQSAALARGIGSAISDSPAEEAERMRNNRIDQTKSDFSAIGYPLYDRETGQLRMVSKEEYQKRRGGGLG